MKVLYRLFFAVFLVTNIDMAAAQILIEDFTDGNLNDNPNWVFSGSDFIVNSGRLQSNNVSASAITYSVSTVHNSSLNQEFRFDFELQFNPSSQNYVDFFITADSQKLENVKNGYFVRIGNTKDEISLYLLKNGIATEIISGRDGILNQNTNSFSVKTTYSNYIWQLFTKSKNEDTFYKEGNFTETQPTFGNHVGLRITQTVSNQKKHYFDNIYSGPQLLDTAPAQIQSIQLLEYNKLQIEFTKSLTKIELSELYIQGFGNPISAILHPNKTSIVEAIWLNSLLPGQTYQLVNSGSTAKNGSKTRTHQFSFIAKKIDTANKLDLIFTEILANPLPIINNLPGEEFVEIYNKSNKYVTLGNLLLCDASSCIALPDSVLPPKSFAIVTKKSSANWHKYGNWIACNSFISLNNSGDSLKLISLNKSTIHAMYYSDKQFESEFKKSGGWSLELVDTNHLCLGQYNWKENQTLSATPGQPNSVAGSKTKFPNTFFHQSVIKENNIVQFSTNIPLFVTSLVPNQFFIEETGENPTSVNWNKDSNLFFLTFASPFSHQRVYHLQATKLKNCIQSQIANTNISVGLPDTMQIAKQDIVFNEIMYNAGGEEFEYVEFTNVSNKNISINKLFFAIANDSWKITQLLPVSQSQSLLYPNQNGVICKDFYSHLEKYKGVNAALVFENPEFVNLPSSSGNIILLNERIQEIDRMQYHDGIHSPLLNNTKSVSLEKFHPTLLSIEKSNWGSANEYSNYATPTNENSIFIKESTKKSSSFQLLEPYFSPALSNNSVLKIAYHLPQSQYFVTIAIYNQNGIKIAQPFSNFSIGMDGLLIWNGRNDQKQIMPAGNYIAKISAFSPTGNTENAKLVFSILQ